MRVSAASWLGGVEGGCDKLPRVSRKSPPQVGQRDSERDNQGRFDPLCASPKVGQTRQSAVATPSRRCAPSQPQPHSSRFGVGGGGGVPACAHQLIPTSRHPADLRPPSKGCRDVKLHHLHLVTGYTPLFYLTATPPFNSQFLSTIPPTFQPL